MDSNFNSAIGQQQFMKLMVAQLQYQDPLQPVQQEDFLSQLAQFSTLDGIEQMNIHFDDLLQLQSLSQGADIVGRNVEYFSPATSQVTQGVVEAARVVDGGLKVTINGEKVALKDISAVLASSAE